VNQATGSDVPCIRADWFIVTATRPPLYHKLLDLPTDVLDLEKGLNVDIEKAFQNNQLVRSGVIQSGVSKQNRLIERLPTPFGAYWKSYDFQKNDKRGDLLQFPLGPVFNDNTFKGRAFIQAGGEIVFNLPNGLQGYLLVDKKGKRIDSAPADIVQDNDHTAGSPVISNGLQCMVCHNNGIKECRDVLRTQSGLEGAALTKLQQLHPTPQVMEQYFRKDEQRFLKSLDTVMGPFLKTPAGRGKGVQDFKEPMKEVARDYFHDVTLEQAAHELGIQDPKALQSVILRSSVLQKLGLKPLAEGGSLKREAWEGAQRTESLFQQTSRLLQRGTPVVSN
jgi:serine/threonine-protein kinase